MSGNRFRGDERKGVEIKGNNALKEFGCKSEVFLNGLIWDFLGGPGVKNPLSNGGNTGLIPDQGTKIPHALQPRPHVDN